jgi:hypothetical protein
MPAFSLEISMIAVLSLPATAPGPQPPSPAVVLLWAVVIGLMAGFAYRLSIRRHPYRPCRKCGESGKHRGAVFTSSFRACTRCGGTGRELRPFASEPDRYS